MVNAASSWEPRLLAAFCAASAAIAFVSEALLVGSETADVGAESDADPDEVGT